MLGRGTRSDTLGGDVLPVDEYFFDPTDTERKLSGPFESGDPSELNAAMAEADPMDPVTWWDLGNAMRYYQHNPYASAMLSEYQAGLAGIRRDVQDEQAGYPTVGGLARTPVVGDTDAMAAWDAYSPWVGATASAVRSGTSWKANKDWVDYYKMQKELTPDKSRRQINRAVRDLYINGKDAPYHKFYDKGVGRGLRIIGNVAGPLDAAISVDSLIGRGMAIYDTSVNGANREKAIENWMKENGVTEEAYPHLYRRMNTALSTSGQATGFSNTSSGIAAAADLVDASNEIAAMAAAGTGFGAAPAAAGWALTELGAEAARLGTIPLDSVAERKFNRAMYLTSKEVRDRAAYADYLLSEAASNKLTSEEYANLLKAIKAGDLSNLSKEDQALIAQTRGDLDAWLSNAREGYGERTPGWWTFFNDDDRWETRIPEEDIYPDFLPEDIALRVLQRKYKNDPNYANLPSFRLTYPEYLKMRDSQ